MKSWQKLPNSSSLLWIALVVLSFGTLIASYFNLWVLVAVLGVLALEAATAVYFLKRRKAPKKESDEERVSEAFGDTLVRDIMVPRTDILSLSASFNVEDSLDLMLFNGFSRMPVYGESIDEIKGIIHFRDLMVETRDDKGKTSLLEIMREATFVPEVKRISDLLREMQEKRFHVAIAIDEYGGTAGLVTLEDLIEEIVGEISDEFDIEMPLIERLGESDFRVNGRVSISELDEQLGVELPKGNWSTVGGFIFNTLGHLPEEGEELVSNGNRFYVERLQGRRIARVRISSNEQQVR